MNELARSWRTDNKVARWLAWRLLRFAECLLLMAYGWKRTNAPASSEEAWIAPDGHPKAGQPYGYSHAINSTRYYVGRSYLAPRPQRLRDQGRKR